MAMRWYAVHTLSGCEEKAKQALLKRIELHGLTERFGQVEVPSEKVEDSRTKRTSTRRFFPGYMLVQMDLDNETWHLVKNTPKITGFVGGARNPPAVPDFEVDKILNLSKRKEEVRPVVDFEIDEEVRLTEGSYASMRGRIKEINPTRGKLRVEITIFGRPVSTELGFHQVEKLA